MDVRIIERVSTFTPLGLRFWDPAFDRPVTDGMTATARPWDRPGAAPVRAVRGPSGALSFHGLPGLRRIENGGPGATLPPPPTRRFLVQIVDAKARYAPAAIGIDLPLPYPGPFVGPVMPATPPPGFFLLSGPNRRPEPALARVGGTLARAATGAPVAWALVTVTDPDGGIWQGISGPDGRFAIALPWPALDDVAPTVPPGGAARALSQRSWPLDIAVQAAPAPLPSLTADSLPDYAAVLTQAPAQIWPAPPGAVPAPVPAPTLTATLAYGAPLTLRSGPDSRLLIGDPPT